MVLSASLFTVGAALLATRLSTVAGALFGAGASLLGAWVSELNNRRSLAEEKTQREASARRYFAPELHRIIERSIYIHERSIVNFISASASTHIEPTDQQEDFIPYMPVLYPAAPQLRDLPADEAVALIAFYDSLHAIDKVVQDWWRREGQLKVNFFNMILHLGTKNLTLAETCIQKFKLEELFPPEYESWPTLSARISRSKSNADEARHHHLERANKGSATYR